MKRIFVVPAMLAVLNLCACGGGSAKVTPTPPVQPTLPTYTQNVTTTSDWMETQQLSDGAIKYSATEIEPYFANLGATGWLSDPTKIPQVEAWMQWYVNHLNSPDYNGLNGTVYDYSLNGTTETSSVTYDSADSYAATFLSLAEALWNTGDSGAHTFIQTTIGESKFLVIASVIPQLQQPNGLVFSRPDYQIEYLMDNTEDYRGLTDFANLATQAWNDTASTASYTASAAKIQSGIQNVLFIPSSGLYYTSFGAPAPNLSTWYPDAVAQIFPIANGVIAPTSTQATAVYTAFNDAWPKWPELSFSSQDASPWCEAGYAAYLMGDTTSTNSYLISIQNAYLNANPSFPWPFIDSEAGWFMRTNAGMETLK